MQALVQDQSMKRALIVSAALHLLILIVATLGLPFFKKKPPEIIELPPIVNVELVSKAPTSAPQQPPAPPKVKTAPKMTAEAPPDLSKTLMPKTQDAPPPDEQADAVPLPPETLAKPLPAKPKPPKPKKELTKKVPDQSAEQFNSLLKNLMEPEETPKPQWESPPREEPPPEEPIQNAAPSLDQRLNVNEIDAVRQQLAGCWNVLSGARYAEDLVVEVKLYINPDRTVRKAVIVDQLRYNRDPLFRAAADSALRAVRTPRCSPLRLPPEKYEQWKVTTIKFDPRDML